MYAIDRCSLRVKHTLHLEPALTPFERQGLIQDPGSISTTLISAVPSPPAGTVDSANVPSGEPTPACDYSTTSEGPIDAIAGRPRQGIQG